MTNNGEKNVNWKTVAVLAGLLAALWGLTQVSNEAILGTKPWMTREEVQQRFEDQNRRIERFDRILHELKKNQEAYNRMYAQINARTQVIANDIENIRDLLARIDKQTKR